MICSYLEFLEFSGQSILAESLYGVFPVLLGLGPKKHPSSVCKVLASIPLWNSECFFQVLLSIHTILFVIQLKLINLFLRGSFVKNIRFSSLFAAEDASRGGTSATQRQKFHTNDANQCLHNKSRSHGVPITNLSNFTCLMVDFGKVLCSSANELQQNSTLLLEKSIFHKY